MIIEKETSHRGTVFNPQIDEMVKEKFGPNVPSITEMEQRTAVAFVNTNAAFNPTAPLPENVIAVGGLHIANTKPLPKVKAQTKSIIFIETFGFSCLKIISLLFRT